MRAAHPSCATNCLVCVAAASFPVCRLTPRRQHSYPQYHLLCCACLRRLKKLQLGKNRLGSLDMLSAVTNLTQLSIEDNELSSLAGLEPLVCLMELYAGMSSVAVSQAQAHKGTMQVAHEPGLDQGGRRAQAVGCYGRQWASG